jgi:hypothetical protein
MLLLQSASARPLPFCQSRQVPGAQNNNPPLRYLF